MILEKVGKRTCRPVGCKGCVKEKGQEQSLIELCYWEMELSTVIGSWGEVWV